MNVGELSSSHRAVLFPGDGKPSCGRSSSYRSFSAHGFHGLHYQVLIELTDIDLSGVKSWCHELPNTIWICWPGRHAAFLVHRGYHSPLSPSFTYCSLAPHCALVIFKSTSSYHLICSRFCSIVTSFCTWYSISLVLFPRIFFFILLLSWVYDVQACTSIPWFM